MNFSSAVFISNLTVAGKTSATCEFLLLSGKGHHDSVAGSRKRRAFRRRIKAMSCVQVRTCKGFGIGRENDVPDNSRLIYYILFSVVGSCINFSTAASSFS